MGSTLLDLDLLQQQQQRHGPSPSPSFGGGFGLPPSPDMQGSFYPEQHFFPQQPMGPTIQQAGGEQMSEIDENEMVRLLMREMIPDILADCHKLQLTPSKSIQAVLFICREQNGISAVKSYTSSHHPSL